MSEPRGNLTGIQLEIMELLWKSDKPLGPAEIWQELQSKKPYARSTINTMVTRLTKRGWLVAEGEGRFLTYHPVGQQGEVTTKVASDVLNQFFGGSASRFVTSLLGGQKISQGEIQKLKNIIHEYEEKNK